ncbi:unnamed protein product [Dicrocoelium dendriticum]|nr:unnamed protein product [Dicrocoelium dendriticum]
MRTHFKAVHSNERPHKCNYCDKTFTRMHCLRVHEKSVHLKQRPHTCEHCGKSFAEKGNLRQHLKSVHSMHAFTGDATSNGTANQHW